MRKPEEISRIIKNESVDEVVANKLTSKEWSSQLVSQHLGHSFNSYTQGVNKKYKSTGSLFERPFERKKVKRKSHFCNLICYFHRNPKLHNFADDFRTCTHSSYQLYLSDKKTRFNKAESINRFGGIENFKKVHNELAELSGEIKIE